MMTPRLATLVLAVTAFAAPAFAAKGDVEAGKQKSVACQACHGADGNSIDPMYPKLAGQYADYLAHSLHGYRDGTRNNAIMAGFAATLSDQDIADLAAYYSALPSSIDDLSRHLKAK
ncbi:MAG TPA: cytochrome c [Dokdonella sp.]|uniref:c-type cytochrome n=2 Tax=Dokdonella sp. TaxID=2291710 RepID=UPI0025C00AE0|nr:cytochrome c [Dokdonella sp.]HNR91039.1 cytochrome c [Dokdonella sp.]